MLTIFGVTVVLCFIRILSGSRKILIRHLGSDATMSEITDAMFVMEMTIGNVLKVIKKQVKRKKEKAKNGNRRELKLKEDIKEHRQLTARTSNELYIRKTSRKATKKRETYY